jgi:hypothetical protein
MIGFVDKAARIEPLGEGFLMTLKSGETETAFMLTRHALAALSALGGLRVQEAAAKEAVFVPSEFTRRKQGRARS